MKGEKKNDERIEKSKRIEKIKVGGKKKWNIVLMKDKIVLGGRKEDGKEWFINEYKEIGDLIVG